MDDWSSCHHHHPGPFHRAIVSSALPSQVEEERTAQPHGACHGPFDPRRSGLAPRDAPGDEGNDGDGGEIATPGPAGRHHELDGDAAALGTPGAVGEGERDRVGGRCDGRGRADDDQRGADGGVVEGGGAWGPGQDRTRSPHDSHGDGAEDLAQRGDVAAGPGADDLGQPGDDLALRGDDFAQRGDADGPGADGIGGLSRKVSSLLSTPGWYVSFSRAPPTGFESTPYWTSHVSVLLSPLRQ